MCIHTIQLQFFVVKYFHDFCEFHNDHENFCHENFLTAAYSTGLDTSKSRKSNESQKSDKITKIFDHENLELYIYSMWIHDHM